MPQNNDDNKSATQNMDITIDFFYNSQGYIDIELCSKMANIPSIYLEKRLLEIGYKKSDVSGQYIKEK